MRRSADAQATQLATFVQDDTRARQSFGPPGDHDPASFASLSVYYGPAPMWDALRTKVGDEKFWATVRDWPKVHAYGNATREDYIDWLSQRTGQYLTGFFDAWLMDPRRRTRADQVG